MQKDIFSFSSFCWDPTIFCHSREGGNPY